MSIHAKIPDEVLPYGEFDWKGEFTITKSMPENIKKIYEDYQNTLKKFFSTDYLKKSIDEITEDDLTEY